MFAAQSKNPHLCLLFRPHTQIHFCVLLPEGLVVCMGFVLRAGVHFPKFQPALCIYLSICGTEVFNSCNCICTRNLNKTCFQGKKKIEGLFKKKSEF